MLFVHIGFRKAGSTTIQFFLARNAKALAEQGLLYPKAGRDGQAHFNLSDELRGADSFKPRIGGLRELREVLDANPDHKTIISSEALHILRIHAVRRFAEGVAGHPVTVLAYVRPLPSFVDSQYRQGIKAGKRTKDFDDFFKKKAGEAAEDYTEKVFGQLETWAEVFGWPALRVRMLEPANLAGGDLISDLLEALGLDLADLPGAGRDAAARRNASPGWKVIELIRRLNQHLGPIDDTEGDYGVAHRAAGRLRHHAEQTAREQGIFDERGVYLTQEQWEHCCEANDRLINQLNGVLEGAPLRGSPPATFQPRAFLPEAAQIPEDERLAFFERLTVALAWEARRGGSAV